MSHAPETLDIACDEAGHTGPDLLHAAQRYFAYASVAISDSYAEEIIRRARRDHPVQMPELKASGLVKTERGRALVLSILREVDGKYAINVHDKLLALCGWIFEYIYEPVYRENPWLLYEKGFHKFVAMYCWLWFHGNQSEAAPAVKQFQAYMRSKKAEDAPLFFEKEHAQLTGDPKEHPFDLVLIFAKGYRQKIIEDNSGLRTVLPDGGRWTLDLSASGLWSHLNFWGRKGKALRVRCDASKPLQAIADKFTGDDRDPGIFRARLTHPDEQFGWRLTEPVEFVDSRTSPAIQLADILAGTAVAISSGNAPDLEGAVEHLDRHMLADSIMPDFEALDLNNRAACVNWLMLYDLAKRAERQLDPYYALEETFAWAEVSWSKGDFSVRNPD